MLELDYLSENGSGFLQGPVCGFCVSIFCSWFYAKMASSLSQWLKYIKNEPPKMARPLSQWLKFTAIYANG